MIIFALLACRPDPGEPVYPDPEPWVLEGDDFYDDPLAVGEERLALGVFYEGQATETLVVDDVTNHFYVYENTFTNKPTDDRWEGYLADELTNNGVGWWGGGVHWDTPRDVSGWDSLHVVARTTVATEWDIGITGGGNEARVSAASLGLVADGEWHVLEVPLSSFSAGGANLASVTVGLLLVGQGGAKGDTLTIDGVYYRRGL